MIGLLILILQLTLGCTIHHRVTLELVSKPPPPEQQEVLDTVVDLVGEAEPKR